MGSTRRHRLAWIALVGYWIVLATATHLPPSRLPETGIKDKYEHFGAYVLLAALLCVVLASRGMSILDASWRSFLIALSYGAIDEWTQPLVGRTCSLMDWIADAAGAGVAIAVFLLVSIVRAQRAAAVDAVVRREQEG
jgi:VanZ family protein